MELECIDYNSTKFEKLDRTNKQRAWRNLTKERDGVVAVQVGGQMSQGLHVLHHLAGLPADGVPDGVQLQANLRQRQIDKLTSGT